MGRTVAITGSVSGLGAAVRGVVEADGDRVLGVDLVGDDVEADLATEAGRDHAVRTVLAEAGHRLDGLVPCAGVGPHLDDHGLIVSVNFFGALAVLDGCVDALAAGSAPAAVVIASHAAVVDPTVDADLATACLAGDEGAARDRAARLAGHSAYATTKAALSRAVRHRAASWGERGIRLNAVAPGPIDTPLLEATFADPVLGEAARALPIPLGAPAAPAEIAAVVRFLLSPQSSYVHGAILVVDGGVDAVLSPDRVP